MFYEKICYALKPQSAPELIVTNSYYIPNTNRISEEYIWNNRDVFGDGIIDIISFEKN